jgi:nucleoside-diphosphate-sugar epimerase
MNILVIGSNGKVGKHLVRILAKKGHTVNALIRSNEQSEAIIELGGNPAVGNLEEEIGNFFFNTDVVIFTAGSGGHTGADKTILVDLLGAIKTIDESVKHGVDRYIMVSAIGANNPSETIEKMRHYFVAKAEADKYLVKSNLNYTIFRPGRLTEEPAKGKITTLYTPETIRTTSREEVAYAIAESIEKPKTYRKTIDILDGDTPVSDAFDNL